MFRFFVSMLIVLVLLWSAGFAWFVLIPPQTINRKDLPPTEAIVVFTGGENRVSSGLDLFLENKSKYLFVSGVAKRVTLPELVGAAKFTMDQIPCCVELGREAADTIGNARETAEWLKQKNVNEFILVTSVFHMRRSLLEMKIVRPDVTIYPYAVAADQPRNWKNWKQSYVWRFHLNEYHKFLYAAGRYFLQNN